MALIVSAHDAIIVDSTPFYFFSTKFTLFSSQAPYPTDAPIFLRACPIICLANRIITRLCAESVY